MNTTSVGREAENIVAKELVRQNHEILAMNWRTRWCEIDIVSKKDKTVYFTEVKFRRSADWGSGIEYITSKKLKQMKFAAEFWLSENNWNKESLLQAVEVDDKGKMNFVEVI